MEFHLWVPVEQLGIEVLGAAAAGTDALAYHEMFRDVGVGTWRNRS